jgi:hypothetical protein
VENLRSKLLDSNFLGDRNPVEGMTVFSARPQHPDGLLITTDHLTHSTGHAILGPYVLRYLEDNPWVPFHHLQAVEGAYVYTVAAPAATLWVYYCYWPLFYLKSLPSLIIVNTI